MVPERCPAVWQWPQIGAHALYRSGVGWEGLAHPKADPSPEPPAAVCRELNRIVDTKLFILDQTPDPDLTFKEISAPTPDPVSNLATLVSTSRKLGGNYTDVYVT
jgi:hypothetical protein